MAPDFSHLRSWERSRPIVPKNHLKSSDWAMQKKQPQFHPSYEDEEKIDIKKLLAMEYARIWQIERESWDDRKIQVDHRAARHAEWVKKWKEVQRGYKRADLQRRKIKQEHLTKPCPNCPCKCCNQ